MQKQNLPAVEEDQRKKWAEEEQEQGVVEPVDAVGVVLASCGSSVPPWSSFSLPLPTFY